MFQCSSHSFRFISKSLMQISCFCGFHLLLLALLQNVQPCSLQWSAATDNFFQLQGSVLPVTSKDAAPEQGDRTSYYTALNHPVCLKQVKSPWQHSPTHSTKYLTLRHTHPACHSIQTDSAVGQRGAGEHAVAGVAELRHGGCLLYTSPSPRD